LFEVRWFITLVPPGRRRPEISATAGCEDPMRVVGAGGVQPVDTKQQRLNRRVVVSIRF
jgi:hypothetical protein